VGVSHQGRPVVKVYIGLTASPDVPGRLDGVPVLVERTGFFLELPKPPDTPGNGPGGGNGGGGGGKKEKVDPTARFPRPVPIGVSTGNIEECSAGTIGCRVVDADGNVYALSNNHVYALENQASAGSTLVQPGRFDVDCAINPSDQVGTLGAYVPLKFDGSENLVDAALGVSSTSNLSSATPSDGYGTPKSATVAAALSQDVQKYGRTTGQTRGRITGIHATVQVTYTSGTALFTDQVIVEGTRGPFIKAGDSGSLMVTRPGRNPVGLLFAGSSNGKVGVANPIDAVLSALNVQIDGE